MRSLVLILLAALPLRAAAEPSCAEQKKALAAWLQLAAADRDGGAILAADGDALVGLPLHKGERPELPAVMLVVEKGGVRDGTGALVPPSRAKAVIEANANIAWLREHPDHAASRGILVAAHADAPAASVQAAVAAALASSERTWLLFRPTDKHVTAPAASPVGQELDKIGSKDVQALVGVIGREFGACPPLMKMLQSMGGMTEADRLAGLIAQPSGALETCRCKPSGPTVAAILWKLAFRDLGTVVEVKGKADALPWGKGTWIEAAPTVVKAL